MAKRGNISPEQISFPAGTFTTGDGVKIASDGTIQSTGGPPSGGSVTSVALTMPSDFSVSGSPITGSGTLAVTGGVTKSGVQQESYTYAADSGTTNAFAVTLSPAPTIVAGSAVQFKAAHANTGASTLAVNGGGATSIKKNGATALSSGDIASGQIVEVIYDGTNWQLIGGSGSGGSVTSVALSMPAEFSVSGSPVTGSGTLTVTKANETANTVFSGPTTGGAAAPTFRALVTADLPSPLNTGGSGSVTVGTRASLPGTAGANGAIYVCTDSPFGLYASDGSSWNGLCYGIAVSDPALDSSLVSLNTTTPASSSVTTSQGGVILQASFSSGDHCYAYAKPVTPSSTLKIGLGFQVAGTATTGFGPVIWNNNTGKVVFLRYAGANFYYSRYQTSTGFSANSQTTNGPQQEWSGDSSFEPNPWPTMKGSWAIRFDGTNWYCEWYADLNGNYKTYTVVTAEALTAWIGTDYTHVGFGINGGGLIWGQHLKIISA